jgi:hypothetical protein
MVGDYDAIVDDNVITLGEVSLRQFFSVVKKSQSSANAASIPSHEALRNARSW